MVEIHLSPVSSFLSLPCLGIWFQTKLIFFKHVILLGLAPHSYYVHRDFMTANHILSPSPQILSGLEQPQHLHIAAVLWILTQASCCWCKPVPGSQPHLWMRMVLPHRNVTQPSSPKVSLSGKRVQRTPLSTLKKSLGLSGEYNRTEVPQGYQTCPEHAKNSGLAFI